ncbi:FecR family protein [Reichenbachiella agariperforans]|uniref:FecR family protein n=1 Tax=Reichenbachiella agariperforans TaxID=156994 RepID=UPI001C0852EE|nr:FecR family protein [Reichenbachiella agariperforans]MBU2915721.1 FecR domain-containing protein [Reichenbachiella agariperforans]
MGLKDKKKLQELLRKYEQGVCTQAEREVLHLLFDSFQRDEEMSYSTSEIQVRAEIFTALNQRINSEIRDRHVPQRMFLQIAASILLVVGLGLSGYFISKTPPPQVAQVIKTTERGQKLTVTLPDGSVVQLNSGSRIIYPEVFENTREISLSGEAFFSVKKNPDKPFVVHTGDIHTKVLGTSFNIHAFPSDKQVEVTVATGRVNVSRDQESVDLVPGEQVAYHGESNQWTHRQVDLENYLAWKDGVLNFEGTTIEKAMEEISMWYDVDVSFDQPQSNACDLKMKFKQLSLTQVLDQIKLVTGIEYEMKEREVKVMGRACH